MADKEPVRLTKLREVLSKALDSVFRTSSFDALKKSLEDAGVTENVDSLESLHAQFVSMLRGHISEELDVISGEHDIHNKLRRVEETSSVEREYDEPEKSLSHDKVFSSAKPFEVLDSIEKNMLNASRASLQAEVERLREGVDSMRSAVTSSREELQAKQEWLTSYCEKMKRHIDALN